MTLIEVIDFAREILKDELDSTSTAVRTFPDDTSTFFKDTTLIRFFNREQNRVQNKVIQSFENYFVTSTTITIVNQQEEYSMPSGALKIVRVEDVENTLRPISLTPMSINQKDNVTNIPITAVSSNGIATHYAIKGNSFILRPIPSRGLTNGLKVYFSQEILDLSAASSVSVIPKEFHEILAVGTAIRGLLKQEAPTETIAAYRAHYNDLFREMTASAEDRQVQRSRTVKRTRNTRRR